MMRMTDLAEHVSSEQFSWAGPGGIGDDMGDPVAGETVNPPRCHWNITCDNKCQSLC